MFGQQIRRRIQTGDADKGRIKRRRQTLRHTCSDTQTGKRAGTLCIDDDAQIRRRNTRLFKQNTNLRQNQIGLFRADIFMKRNNLPIGLQREGQVGSAGVDGKDGSSEIGLHGVFFKIKILGWIIALSS